MGGWYPNPYPTSFRRSLLGDAAAAATSHAMPRLNAVSGSAPGASTFSTRPTTSSEMAEFPGDLRMGQSVGPQIVDVQHLAAGHRPAPPSQLPLSSCAVEPSAGPLGDLLPLDGGELERDHGDQSSAAGDVGHVGRQVHYLQVDAAVREGLE